MKIYDKRQCLLGEGLLWHPELNQLFWFDILGKKLLSQKNNKTYEWTFNEMPSASGWIDKTKLLIAFESNLSIFDISNSQLKKIITLEEDNITTRSNDGRTDPWGGFWIGTMGKKAEKNAGKIYRFYKGNIQVLYNNITVSNSICFSPNKLFAYYTDTFTNKIMKQKLDNNGWPKSNPEIFVDLSKKHINPDGSIVDSEGCLWNAEWGSSKCTRYDHQGNVLEEKKLPVSQITCPALGGENLQTLYLTSASTELKKDELNAGCVFYEKIKIKGQKENRIILD